MDMREKTVKALEKAIQCFERYSGDEYGREYNYTHVEVEVLEDAVALLKAQEPLKPVPSDRYVRTEPVTFDYKCVVCNAGLVRHWVCCPCCGQAVKWE